MIAVKNPDDLHRPSRLHKNKKPPPNPRGQSTPASAIRLMLDIFILSLFELTVEVAGSCWGHSSRIIVPRCRAVPVSTTLSAGSADVGRQVLIRRDEFFPACFDVVGFTASEVRGEVFGVDLPAGSEESDRV